jgi:hypothetical protein
MVSVDLVRKLWPSKTTLISPHSRSSASQYSFQFCTDTIWFLVTLGKRKCTISSSSVVSTKSISQGKHALKTYRWNCRKLRRRPFGRKPKPLDPRHRGWHRVCYPFVFLRGSHRKAEEQTATLSKKKESRLPLLRFNSSKVNTTGNIPSHSGTEMERRDMNPRTQEEKCWVGAAV